MWLDRDEQYWHGPPMEDRVHSTSFILWRRYMLSCGLRFHVNFHEVFRLQFGGRRIAVSGKIPTFTVFRKIWAIFGGFWYPNASPPPCSMISREPVKGEPPA